MVSTTIPAFTEGSRSPRYIPVELSTPLFRLTGTPFCNSFYYSHIDYSSGHESIVNSTLIHPHLPYIVTAGVEKNVVLHSPKASSPCCTDMQLTSPNVRNLDADGTADRTAYVRALTDFDIVTGEESEDSETMTIRMFDQ